eukprot:SAG31_NODE_24271_length_485_cov_0.940415_1_plen_71_part_01
MGWSSPRRSHSQASGRSCGEKQQREQQHIASLGCPSDERRPVAPALQTMAQYDQLFSTCTRALPAEPLLRA